MKTKLSKLISVILAMALVLSAFGAVTFAADFTKLETTDGAVTLDGTNPGTVTVYWTATDAQNIYTIEGSWSLKETEATSYLELTAIGSEVVTFTGMNYVEVSTGRLLWSDDTFSNPGVLSNGKHLLSATYKVAADTPAGTYTVKYSSVNLIGNDYENDGTDALVEPKIVVTRASGTVHPDKPTIDVTGTYTYNGADQTATVTGFDSATMNITGNVAKNAGDYTVSVTSKTGKWADETTAPVTKEWSIEKADPTYTIPTALTGTKDNALSSVTLPSGWAWKTPATVMDTVGNQTFAAIYTPEDTANYNTKEENITVAVSEPPAVNPAKPTIDVTGTYTYNGADQTAAVTGFDSATMNITGNVAKNAGDYTVSVTSKTGKWADETTAPVTKDWRIEKAEPTGTPKITPITLSGKTLGDAAITTTGADFSVPGSVQWVAEDGVTALAPATEVMANIAYKWLFTPDDNANYKTITGTLTPYYVEIPHRSGGGGGSTRYSVSFDANGGSRVSSQTIAKNSVIKEPAAPTKEGFDFAGWYTDKELKTKYDFSAKVTKSFTLYAAWTQKDNSENQIILTIGKTTAQVFGKAAANDVAPKIVNSRTMLPARFVAESLGAKVEWNGEKELVTITGKNVKTNEAVTILVTIGAKSAFVNGKEVELDSAAFIENSRTYTPIRFISEQLGASVEWVEKEQKVVITK